MTLEELTDVSPVVGASIMFDREHPNLVGVKREALQDLELGSFGVEAPVVDDGGRVELAQH